MYDFAGEFEQSSQVMGRLINDNRTGWTSTVVFVVQEFLGTSAAGILQSAHSWRTVNIQHFITCV